MNILIIGAGRGFGKVLSLELKRRGHEVVSGFQRPEGHEWAKEAGIYEVQTDITSEVQLSEAAGWIRETIGELDAVICSAGILLDTDRTQTLMEQSLDDVMRHLQVNAVGVLAAFRAFYPVMKKGGRFFAVTSEGGSFTCAGSLFPSYGLSKTAANKIVQTLRFTIDDVEIISLHPGRMNTEMGRMTAQIEPEEAAEGMCRILEGDIPVDAKKKWFIDYLGNEMPL